MLFGFLSPLGTGASVLHNSIRQNTAEHAPSEELVQYARQKTSIEVQSRLPSGASVRLHRDRWIICLADGKVAAKTAVGIKMFGTFREYVEYIGDTEVEKLLRPSDRRLGTESDNSAETIIEAEFETSIIDTDFKRRGN